MNCTRFLATFGGGALVSIACGQTPASLVIKIGDPVNDSTVTALNSPFTNSLGEVGYVASLSDGSRAIMIGAAQIFNSAGALPDVLSGGESTMGISDAGGFIYSPSFNGNDAVYTQNGLLLADGDPAPGLPGMFSSFNSRPTMTPDGTANWIGGWSDTAGGSSIGRIFYRAAGANPANTTILLKSGDTIDGFPIAASGIGFGYDVSNSGNVIVALTQTTGSTTNDTCVAVYPVGDAAVVVAREGSPTGQGDNWSGTSSMSINDAGDYVVTGDTDGASASDAFVAYNGQIMVREGDSLGGTTLSGSCKWISIDNAGNVAFIHDTAAGEALFYGHAADLTNAARIATTGDSLDTDGDGVGDYTLADFKASSAIGPGLDLAGDGRIFVEADLSDGTTTAEAIIGFEPEAAPPCDGDLDADGDVDIGDLALLLSGFGGAGPAGDIDGDGDVDITDLAILLSAFGSSC